MSGEAAGIPAAPVPYHMAMWADIVALLERSPEGLLAGFDQAYERLWLQPIDQQRNILVGQWKARMDVIGRGNVVEAMDLLYTLLPALALQDLAPYTAVERVSVEPQARAAQAKASLQLAESLQVSLMPPPERATEHSAMWQDVVYALYCAAAAEAGGQQAGQMEVAVDMFWRQHTPGQRDVLEGQWRPVCDSLGRANASAMLHVLMAMMPGLTAQAG